MGGRGRRSGERSVHRYVRAPCRARSAGWRFHSRSPSDAPTGETEPPLGPQLDLRLQSTTVRNAARGSVGGFRKLRLGPSSTSNDGHGYLPRNQRRRSHLKLALVADAARLGSPACGSGYTLAMT